MIGRLERLATYRLGMFMAAHGHSLMSVPFIDPERRQAFNDGWFRGKREISDGANPADIINQYYNTRYVRPK